MENASRRLAKAAERVTIEGAAIILGVPARTVQSLAAAGTLPSAAKVGRRWTFDEAALRRWLTGQEAAEARRCRSEKPRRAATGAAASSGGASRSAARRSGGAYEQAMRRLRSGA